MRVQCVSNAWQAEGALLKLLGAEALGTKERKYVLEALSRIGGAATLATLATQVGGAEGTLSLIHISEPTRPY